MQPSKLSPLRRIPRLTAHNIKKHSLIVPFLTILLGLGSACSDGGDESPTASPDAFSDTDVTPDQLAGKRFHAARALTEQSADTAGTPDEAIALFDSAMKIAESWNQFALAADAAREASALFANGSLVGGDRTQSIIYMEEAIRLGYASRDYPQLVQDILELDTFLYHRGASGDGDYRDRLNETLMTFPKSKLSTGNRLNIQSNFALSHLRHAYFKLGIPQFQQLHVAFRDYANSGLEKVQNGKYFDYWENGGRHSASNLRRAAIASYYLMDFEQGLKFTLQGAKQLKKFQEDLESKQISMSAESQNALERQIQLTNQRKAYFRSVWALSLSTADDNKKESAIRLLGNDIQALPRLDKNERCTHAVWKRAFARAALEVIGGEPSLTEVKTSALGFINFDCSPLNIEGLRDDDQIEMLGATVFLNKTAHAVSPRMEQDPERLNQIFESAATAMKRLNPEYNHSCRNPLVRSWIDLMDGVSGETTCQ